jgi:hypothetical protein
MMEQDNWTTPGLNNFRQNVQGAGVFNAPDLSVSLAVGLDKCDDGTSSCCRRRSTTRARSACRRAST